MYGCDDDMCDSCGIGDEREQRNGRTVVGAMMGLMVDYHSRSLAEWQ